MGDATPPAAWVAITAPLDIEIDLNDVARGDGALFVRDGVGFAARGSVADTDDTDIRRVLSSIELDNRTDNTDGAPVAIGCLPFLPSGRARFVLPEVIVGKSRESRWITVLTPADVDTDRREEALRRAIESVSEPVSRPQPAANSYSVAPLTAVDTYLRAVTAARDAVREGRITKAVIARDIVVDASEPIDLHAVLLRLKASFGSSYRYAFDGLIGASPELLVEVDNGAVRSNPLAGTTARTGDPATDARLASELLASPKNQIEHRVVVDMVHDTLLPHCSYLDWEPEPSVVAVANVQHLGTRVEGRLSSPDTHVLDLARLLCPTPALGGAPRDAAIALIDEVEGMERGMYGGAVGWCDARGNGTFAVTIRCALFDDTRMRARLFAGGGIVADSEPLAELAETQAKFQAMLSAIVRP